MLLVVACVLMMARILVSCVATNATRAEEVSPTAVRESKITLTVFWPEAWEGRQMRGLWVARGGNRRVPPLAYRWELVWRWRR